MDLVEALRPTAHLLASIIANRYRENRSPGTYGWWLWNPGESVGEGSAFTDGYLQWHNGVRYEYHHNPNDAPGLIGYIDLTSIRLQALADQGLGPSQTNGISVRQVPGSATIDINTKLKGSATVHASHDSTVTNSRTSAIAKAWSVGAKVTVGAKLKGIDVGGEVTSSYGQTLTDTATSTTSDTDRSGTSVTADFADGAALSIEQTIGHKSAEVLLDAVVDFDIHMYHATADQWEFKVISLRDAFIPAAQGGAPRDYSGSVWDGSTGGLQQFFSGRYGEISGDEAKRLATPLAGLVKFPATWDEVLQLSIEDRSKDKAPRALQLF